MPLGIRSHYLFSNKKEWNRGHDYVVGPHDTHKYGDVTCGYLCRRNYTFKKEEYALNKSIMIYNCKKNSIE
jgi:hypothetical protein